MYGEATGVQSRTDADEYGGHRVNTDPPAYVTTPLTMIPAKHESK